MKISFLTPTRNRPQNIIRFCNNIAETIKDINSVEIIFYVDNDDYLSIESIEKSKNIISCISYVRGDRILLSDMPNKLLDIATGPYYFLGADDILFRTKDWDQIIFEVFEKSIDKIILVHGRDGIHEGGLATHFFVHKNWIDAIGYILPPYFPADRSDAWMTEVAISIKRKIYLEHLFIEHMHPNVKKSNKDQTYMDGDNQRKNVDLMGIYKSLENERKNDIRKLLMKIDELKSLI
jgi:hypothetical protein